MCNSACRWPVQCVIPPHMAESIELRGTEAQREMARLLLEGGEGYREERARAAPAHAFSAAPVHDQLSGGRVRQRIHDAGGGQTLPGNLVVNDDGSDGFELDTQDEAVECAYKNTLDTYRFYMEAYGRDSIDGHGGRLVSNVHFGQGYNNAFWNGAQMTYGDGDQQIFKTFVCSPSVVAHELSHGVVQFSGGLVYRDQSGALNESFADVMGSLATQYAKGLKAHKADWLVGPEIFAPGVNGTALRSMKAPGTAYNDNLLGKDPQPFHMDGYVNTSSDNGGVHINSGIPNHAFYLLSVILGGRAWEKAGLIWYQTMQEINNPHCTFQEWAEKTLEVASGHGGKIALFTRRAWKLVGIDV